MFIALPVIILNRWKQRCKHSKWAIYYVIVYYYCRNQKSKKIFHFYYNTIRWWSFFFFILIIEFMINNWSMDIIKLWLNIAIYWVISKNVTHTICNDAHIISFQMKNSRGKWLVMMIYSDSVLFSAFIFFYDLNSWSLCIKRTKQYADSLLNLVLYSLLMYMDIFSTLNHLIFFLILAIISFLIHM